MRYKFLLIFLLLIIKVNSQTYSYYVSPKPAGNDSNVGSQAQPFATIEKAQSVIRTQIDTYPMTQDIVVHIGGGTYLLDSALEFTAADSGKNEHFVVYQGEDSSNNKTIISGGKKIDDQAWSRVGTTNIYKANIGNLYSRQVYINGTKATRAKSDDSMGLIETSKGYLSTYTDFSSWNKIKDVEIVSNILWRCNKIPVEYVCEKQLFIEPFFWNDLIHSQKFRTAPVSWVENAIELLDQLNEWYIDKSPNQDNNTLYIFSHNPPTDVVIPRLESLMKGNNMKNIKFTNLSFQYTTWNKPSEINQRLYNNTNGAKVTNNGFYNEQADCYKIIYDPGEYKDLIPGAVSFEGVSKIYVINNDFKHIGSTALSFGAGSSNNIICRNKFEDIAASAIRVGIVDNNNIPNDDIPQSAIDDIHNNLITNNTISNIGKEYFGSVGIFVPYARNTTITHNTLCKFPYGGISVGWGWNKDDIVGVNEISYNRIDCNDQIIPDSGGIYTLNSQGTSQDRTQIKGNYILNQRFYLGGIYLDNYSSNINIQDNVVDANDQLSIPAQINCRDNTNIRSIVFYSYSNNVSISNNYYNGSHYAPPPISESECLPEEPCTNIDVQHNELMTSTNASTTECIKKNSGVQSNFNCN